MPRQGKIAGLLNPDVAASDRKLRHERAKQRYEDEVASLRAKLAELSEQLETLTKARAGPRKSQSVWEGFARRQVIEHQEALRENAKLKHQIEAHMGLLQRLQGVLAQDRHDLLELSDPNAVVSLVEEPSARRATVHAVLDQQFAQLPATYQNTGSHRPSTRGSRSSCGRAATSSCSRSRTTSSCTRLSTPSATRSAKSLRRPSAASSATAPCSCSSRLTRRRTCSSACTRCQSSARSTRTLRPRAFAVSTEGSPLCSKRSAKTHSFRCLPTRWSSATSSLRRSSPAKAATPAGSRSGTCTSRSMRRRAATWSRSSSPATATRSRC
ncbi:hypothetical protein SPRG_15423 [Saprolegnia parasitica CBS 223.65]|uniref:Uncharacterized protein n=1 Tax=Saprolegnia parasitica (strain CBS 223.65) TaxID=695850 RepID=A0A067BMI8_SAPPC|nr:hypothetical protein SPRG_15423 [Saprolegnia parasitica CBS 223.65]KDO19433.1 hypothetical protein SPRG_15423 [Saprolegnia parasitica CBS 223.65]|eukprot:XP_012209859.1 hypothetical protein SPRG_15423 [Saprolegnia parasitica CBS 223.65]